MAIKLIRRDLTSRELRRHFERERQALANLEHPYITRLLDGGTTDDDRPYLVMEFVQGSPIDVYCDSHRLTVVERIKLFRKVCSAVEHAHRNLVIHRDPKPANILVTEEGDPRVLDFGLAKLLDVSQGEAHRDHPADS